MKKCLKCGHIYDDTWKICLRDSSGLIQTDESPQAKTIGARTKTSFLVRANCISGLAVAFLHSLVIIWAMIYMHKKELPEIVWAMDRVLCVISVGLASAFGVLGGLPGAVIGYFLFWFNLLVIGFIKWYLVGHVTSYIVRLFVHADPIKPQDNLST